MIKFSTAAFLVTLALCSSIGSGTQRDFPPLDPAFGMAGVAKATVIEGNWHLLMKMLTDGSSTYALGQVLEENGKFLRSPVIVKFNEDGSTDSRFGDRGKVILASIEGDYGGVIDNPFIDALLERDGSLLISRAVGDPTRQQRSLLRLRTDGSQDLSFGDGGSAVIDNKEFPFEGGVMDPGSQPGIYLQPDGKVLIPVFGFLDESSSLTLYLVRLTPYGKRDETFSPHGIKKILLPENFNGPWDSTIGMQTNSRGEIVLSGVMYKDHKAFAPALVRLNPQGDLDADFGIGGMAIFPEEPRAKFYDVVFDRNEKIVVLTQRFVSNASFYSNLGLYRIQRDGKLDPSFGHDGKTEFHLDTEGTENQNIHRQLFIREDGSFLVAASVSSEVHVFPPDAFHPVLAVVQPGGDLDLRFGKDGFMVFPAVEWSFAFPFFHPAENGKIIGNINVGFATDFTVFKLQR